MAKMLATPVRQRRGNCALVRRRCAGSSGRGLHWPGARVWEHHHARSDRGFLVEIHRILIDHADAAGGEALANCPGLVRAMDAKQRILVSLPKIHGPGAERIGRAAMHANAALQLNHRLEKFGPAVEHFFRRVPVWPLLLALDRGHPSPAEPFAADPDSIAG